MEVTPFPPKMGKCFDSTALRDGNGITRAVLAPRPPSHVPYCSVDYSFLTTRRFLSSFCGLDSNDAS